MTTSLQSNTLAPPTKIILLKTRNTPHDNYETYFASPAYQSVFVPILTHNFIASAISTLRQLITSNALNPQSASARYGGLIFTSQRAVEAFTSVLDHVRSTTPSSDMASYLPQDLVIYVVGPATARCVNAMNLPCSIAGEESGNGEALADLILNHYSTRPVRAASPEQQEEEQQQVHARLPLLFLVGEQRRDIIPRTLQSEALQPSRRIRVDELTVYETGLMPTFAQDLLSEVRQIQKGQMQWLVAFSPAGGDAIVSALWPERTRDGNKAHETEIHSVAETTTMVATIGPTTRDYLQQEFGVEAHVCARKPTPEELGKGILDWNERRRGGLES